MTENPQGELRVSLSFRRRLVLFGFLILFSFEAGSCYVAQAGLAIPLVQPLMESDGRRSLSPAPSRF